MPIADTYVPLKSSGNGSTQDFSFNFYIGSTANLRVYEEDDVTLVQTLKTLGSDYTATFNDDTPGGNVHFLVAPAAGKSIIRAREIPKTQETPLKTSSGFKAEVVQTIVDKLTALVQDVGEIASRAIKLPIGSSSSGVIPAPSAGKAIVGNQTSNGFVNSELDLTTLEDKVDDVDAAVAAAEAAQSAAQAAQTAAELAETNAEAAAIQAAGYAEVRGTFTNSNLSTGVLTITHNLGLSAPYVLTLEIHNNSSKRIYPDDITGSANSVAVDLTSYGTISGTWGYAYKG